MQSSHAQTPKIIGGLAVAIVVGIGGFLAISGVNAQPSGNLSSTSSSTTPSSQAAPQTTTPAADTTTPTTATPTTATTPSTPPAATPVKPSNTYKDGTYNATSSYYVPGGQNSLAVTLTIAGDKITAVKTSSTVDSYESQRYVDRFNSSISSAVVGKALANAYQGRVGGASLTTSAFDDTLQTVMNNAKA